MAIVVKELAGTGGRSVELVGGLKEKLFTVTGDSAYATGGYPVTPAMFGLTSIIAVTDAISGGKVLHHDPVNAKIQVLVCGAATAVLQEVANASDQSLVTAPMRVIGA